MDKENGICQNVSNDDQIVVGDGNAATDNNVATDNNAATPNNAATHNNVAAHINAAIRNNPAIDIDEEGGWRIDDEIYIPPPPRNFVEIDVSGPRLMIAKIVNVNFKSYGGTRSVGPFHKCFSAIVGPNGSGKSNVIDSMLFVFGYRASKIRSKKISVLIHNSNEYPNCNSCTVSVHFQQIIDKPEEDDYDIVPNSEFVISRTAFKDNSSYYEYNKKRVQFKEIAKVLRSYGVDLDHNRFLILQGEVEQIAMMKPKAQTENDTGMLEFLEDIIGTVRYREPLVKLSEKVTVLSEYRVEKLNRLKIVEAEKAALEEPMQEVIQYMRLENIITRLNHEYYHFQRFETAKEVAREEEKMNELEKDLSDLVGQMKEIHDQRAEKTNDMTEKSKSWQSLQEKKDEVTAEFDKIRKKDEALHAELVETNKRRKTNLASVKSEVSKLEEQNRIPAKCAKDIKECEELLETHTRDKEKEELALETLMSGLQEKTEPLLNKRSKLEKELITLRKDVDEAQATFDITQSKLQLYTSVEATEKGKLLTLKNTLESTSANLVQRKQQLEDLQVKIPDNQQTLTLMQQELEQVKRKEMETTANLKRMRVSFEEQRSAMQASKSRNKILESLMREKREGRIPGIFGRLGDLGAIDGKYDVAVSTACGPLDNIIVDTVTTAQACIMFLRQNDIGRATFIPLEKQEHLLARCKEKIDTPEGVLRLFDLIRVEDERVLPAFYYGLRDTLVANNLEQGTRIAYGARRFRVVTLKGELIELSGTMSGGGKTAFRGRMGTKVVRSEISAGDIQKLQVDLDKTYQECNQLRARQQQLENQIQSLSIAIKSMSIDKEKMHIEVKTLQEQEPSLQAQLKAQEKKVAESISNPKQVEQMTKVLDDAGKKLEVVKANSKGVESQVAIINKEVQELSGDLVKTQQKKISNLSKLIDKIKGQICKFQVAIKTSERNVKKIQQRIETLESDVHTCEDRLRDIQKEKQEIEEQGKEYLKELTELTEDLTERDEALSSLKEELNTLQARENKMKSVKIDMDQKVKERKGALKELKQQVPELTKRITDLKLQVIPGEHTEELRDPTEEELRELDEMILQANLQKAKKQLPTEIPNMQLIEEYKEKDRVYLRRAADLEQVTTERNKVRDVYEIARRRRIQEFLVGFTLITDKLKEMYQMITLGGDAELELVDSLDPFSEGIAFSVRPPKKSWKNICNLSGGEKTLSSLALVFALHHYKPTPLYFMDEIDAALDFKNVSIVGNYIKERTKNAQFIIISLRSNMFELADYLVGIYKTYNCTKSVTVDLKKYYEKNGIAPPTQITSKNMYSSQTQKLTTQDKPTETQQKDTCAPQNNNILQGIEECGENDEIDSYNLPELGLCSTPEKPTFGTQNGRIPISNIPSNDDEHICTTPVKKKRRI